MAAAAALVFSTAACSQPWGPGMMGGFGPGGGPAAGPGMMGGYGYGPGMMGPGYGAGMMGPGYGPGYGPGMMGPGYGPGYGPGMMGYGYGPGAMGPGYGPGMMGPGAGWGINRMAPDLTDDQQKKIADIRLEFGRKQWELAQQMHSLVWADGAPADDQAARKNYDAVAALHKQMFENQLEARKRIDGVLTPQQRESLRRR